MYMFRLLLTTFRSRTEPKDMKDNKNGIANVPGTVIIGVRLGQTKRPDPVFIENCMKNNNGIANIAVSIVVYISGNNTAFGY